MYLLIILTPLAKLIHVIRHCLNACIQRTLQECPEAHQEHEKENASVSGSHSTAKTGRLCLVSFLYQWIGCCYFPFVPVKILKYSF